MNKKIKIWIWILVLILVYFFFFRNSSEYFFQAKDLEVKNITNKSDFENIIIANLYDKIVEKCEKPRRRERYYNTRDTFWWWGWWLKWHTTWLDSIKPVDDRLVWSDNGWWFFWNSYNGSIGSSFKGDITKASVESVALDSIDFNWDNNLEANTQKSSFSKTNIQKKNVDEWDILKQTKDYIFYFSKKQAKIFIIKSPLNWEKIDLKNVKKIWTINIPNNLTQKAELFVNKNRLVYIASKKDYENNNTIVWIYDISELSQEKITLLKIFETKWEYFKSRLINNNLYLISDYSIKPLKEKICNKINENKNEKLGFIKFLKYFTWIDFKSRDKKLFEEFKEELETYSYKFDQDKELDSKNKKEKLEKINLFYTKKDLNSDISNLNFNIISVIDIEKKDKKNVQHLLFWDLEWGEIHMTLDNLYLVNSYYKKDKWKCDFDSLCYREYFDSGNFTSISKLSLKEDILEYKKTNVIPGKPINQYSMDEDKWYFRIFTTSWSWKTGTSLYVFSPKFDLTWKLEKIKPWEEFKSSRFIWDKAFLVTFRNTDPLFVIDLHSPAKPKIIWELEIPGYSTYLHPYWIFWDKQYLIWLWEENNKVKIDLYEIDYSKKELWWNISVKQKFTKTLWINNSWTPALENPRTFVWDKEEKKLYLPYFDWFLKKIWVVWLKINKDSWIKQFFKKLHSKYTYLDDFKSSNPRVWYYKKEKTENLVFFINSDFLNFINITFPYVSDVFKKDSKIEEKNIFFDIEAENKYLIKKKAIELEKKERERLERIKKQKEEILKKIENTNNHNDLDNLDLDQK